MFFLSHKIIAEKTAEIPRFNNSFYDTQFVFGTFSLFYAIKQKNPFKNLEIKHKVFTFAPQNRDLAQLVAHTSGGREVAGSSPVIPTFETKRCLIIRHLFVLYMKFAQHA